MKKAGREESLKLRSLKIEWFFLENLKALRVRNFEEGI